MTVPLNFSVVKRICNTVKQEKGFLKFIIITVTFQSGL